MIPVPPPEINELGTGVAATPLNVTLETAAFVAVVFSAVTPMITIRSVPAPRVWDQERDEMLVVEALELAASKEIDAQALPGRPNNRTPHNATNAHVNTDGSERRDSIAGF
jgi:hypothetical protein